MIDKNSSTPCYVKLADIIREKIKTKEIRPGDMLDSESAMVKKYGIARLTVREALNILVNEGLLEKRHGKGTFCKNAGLRKRIHVLLDVTDYYFVPYYMRSIGSVVASNNADLIACDTCNSNDRICEYLEMICKNGSDGVIIQGSPSPKINKERMLNALHNLDDTEIPYVIIDAGYDFFDSSYIIPDETSSGALAAKYFKENNHSKILCVCVDNNNLSEKRLKGFSEVLPDFNAVYNDSRMGDRLISYIKNGVTGIFCFNDYVAKQVLDILESANLSVPNDVSLISVDDTIIAEIYNLTSVTHPKEKIGKEAADLMFNGKLHAKKVYSPKLAVRKSVKKL